MEPALTDAGDRALALVGDLAGGRWAAACQTFAPAVAARLDPAGLATAWAQLAGMIGRYVRHGQPSVYQAGDCTIADIPLFFVAGERMGRVSYGRDGQVAGLFFLPPAMVEGRPGALTGGGTTPSEPHREGTS